MNFQNITVNPMYLEQTAKLITALEKEKIPFETVFVLHGFMVVFPSLENRDGDVILHDGSYGNYSGFFEGYMGMSTEEDDVCVFDSIEEIVELAKKYKEE